MVLRFLNIEEIRRKADKEVKIIMSGGYRKGRNNGNGEIAFSITSHIGVITEYQTGWRKEVNIVAWNEGAPKFDIRDWDPEHEHMSRGITLHEDEARCAAEMITDWLQGRMNKLAAREEERQRAMAEKKAQTMEEAMVDADEVMGNADTEYSQLGLNYENASGGLEFESEVPISEVADTEVAETRVAETEVVECEAVDSEEMENVEPTLLIDEETGEVME